VGSPADPAAVRPWVTLEAPLPAPVASGGGGGGGGATCRYPVDAVLNSKISLWVGDAFRLGADAVAIESPKNFASLSAQAAGLEPFDTFNLLAGKQFTEELRFLDDCRVGDVKLVKGYHLPCSNVLLVGCPYFRRNHASASLSGLHQCYRRSIEFAIDCNAATLGIRSSKSHPPRLF
jgi:hypothetical protein